MYEPLVPFKFDMMKLKLHIRLKITKSNHLLGVPIKILGTIYMRFLQKNFRNTQRLTFHLHPVADICVRGSAICVKNMPFSKSEF